MAGERDRTGEFAHRIGELEEGMKELRAATIGDSPTSLKARVGSNEEEKRVRVATFAAVATTLGCVFSLVVWVARTGIIESLDAMREDLRAMKRAAIVRPVEVSR